MSSWQVWLLIIVFAAGACVACWFISANTTEKRMLAEFAAAPKDTVWGVDTLWREVVRIRTVFRTRVDTIYQSVPVVDTSYVASADTAGERFKAHLEFASPIPLSPEARFQNIRVDGGSPAHYRLR